MTHIMARQTFVFSVYLDALTGATPSQISTQINLRFAADELIVKSMAYNPRSLDVTDPSSDIPDVVQIWCNITNDNLIGAFPNAAPIFAQHDTHFRTNNTFQTGNFLLQFQTTDQGQPFFYNPQPL